MANIKYKNCNFTEKTKIKSDDHYEVYHDEHYLYKINKNLSKNQITYNSFYNFRLSKLSHIKISNCVFPDAKIRQGIQTVGSRSPYIIGRNLSDFFDYSEEFYTFLNFVYNMSLKHQEIHSHPANIVIGDTNFTNVLYNDSTIPYLVDFDDCGIGRIPATACSITYVDYCMIHGCALSSYTQISDIFSDFLEFIKVVFNKTIDEITEYELDALAEKSESIACMKGIIQYARRSHGIYRIPYLHEFISQKDFDNKELILKR